MAASGAARVLKVLVVVVAAGAGLGACLAFGAGDDDGGGLVAPAGAPDRQATAAQLAQAANAQGVCYGWRLADSSGRTVSQGSNLGDNVAVESGGTRCAKWVEMRAQVFYPGLSSEAEDSATVSVVGSPGLGLSSATLVDRLARLGLTEGAFVGDPGRAICQAALALPLLVAEAGAAEPAPTASAAPTGTPSALADPGSDLWRDRRVFILAAAAIGLVAVLLLLIGFFERRAQRAAAATPTPTPAAAEPGTPP